MLSGVMRWKVIALHAKGHHTLYYEVNLALRVQYCVTGASRTANGIASAVGGFCAA
jgi:hypothetical protein